MARADQPLSSLRYGNSTQIFITAGAAGSVGVFGMMSSGRESDLRRRRGHCGRETAMPGRLSDVAAAEVFGRTQTNAASGCRAAWSGQGW